MNNKNITIKTQPRVSGVDSNTYSKYDFSDHIWFQSPAEFADFITLTNRCVKVDGTYYMRSVGSTVWHEFRKDGDQKREAINTWLNATLPSNNQVTAEMIETYFSGIREDTVTLGNKKISQKVHVGSCPMLNHTISIPMGPEFVIYSGKKYLNNWVDNMVSSDSKELPLGKMMLSLIYRCLCNGAPLANDLGTEAELLWEQIVRDQWVNLDFRFVINWLAAQVQKPGINLTTNLWLCGAQEGVGKGTLVKVMQWILGHNAVGALQPSELAHGWSDHLLGKQLVEINEFEESRNMSKKEWSQWIKRNTCEPTLHITKRGSTPSTVINISNYIITTNEEEPLWVDPTDRRNQFIKTSDSVDAVSFAANVRRQYVERVPLRVAAGFAYVLEAVTVDYEFISRAFTNNFKASIIASSKNEVEEWLENDAALDRDKKIPARDMYESYKIWSNMYRPGCNMLTETAWGRLMAKTKYVQRSRGSKGNTYLVMSDYVPETVDLTVGAKRLEEVLGEEVDAQDYDVKIQRDSGILDLTPTQRLRAKLIAEENRRRDDFGHLGFKEDDYIDDE